MLRKDPGLIQFRELFKVDLVSFANRSEVDIGRLVGDGLFKQLETLSVNHMSISDTGHLSFWKDERLLFVPTRAYDIFQTIGTLSVKVVFCLMKEGQISVLASFQRIKTGFNHTLRFFRPGNCIFTFFSDKHPSVCHNVYMIAVYISARYPL